MADLTQAIVAKLSLDNVKFSKDTSNVTANLTKLAAAGAAVTASALAIAKSTANYQDQMIKASRAAGASVETFSQYSHAANLSAVSNELLQRTFAQLSAPTTKIKKGLSDLNISLTDTQGNVKDNTQLFNELADSVSKMESPAQRAAAVMGVFGERGIKLTNILAAGSEGIEKMKEEAIELGIVVSEKAGKQAELFNDNMTRMQSAIRGASSAIGESIIEFSNQEGILQIIQERIQDFTKFWRGLDSDTKNIILTLGSAAAAISTVTLAVVGLMKIAPQLKAAFAAMTSGPALLATALVTLAFGALKFKKDIMESLSPVIDKLKDLGDRIDKSIKPLAKTLDKATEGMNSFSKNAKDNTKQVSIFGTVVVNIFRVIGSALLVAIEGFEGLKEILTGISLRIAITFNQMKASFAGNAEEMERLKEQAEIVSSVISRRFKHHTAEIEKGLNKIWAGGFLRFDTKKTDKEIDNLFGNLRKQARKSGIESREALTPFEQKIEDIKKAWRDLIKTIESEKPDFKAVMSRIANFGNAIAALMQDIAGKVQVITGVISGFADIAAQNISRSQQILERDIAVRLGKMEKALEIELSLIEQYESDKLSTINQSFDKEIEDLKSQEDRKYLILESEAERRLLLLDSEFQKAKEKKELAFQEEMERERERYEEEKAFLLEKADDNEQRKIMEAMLDEDFKNHLKNLQEGFDAEMLEFAKNFTNKSTRIDTRRQRRKERKERRLARKLERLERQKNRALEKEQRQSIAKKEKAENEHEERRKQLQRKLLERSWNAQKEAFQATKNAEKAETIVSGFSAAAQAFQAYANVPYVGPALGAAAAAAVLALTAVRVQQIEKQKPVKPPELMMQMGGVIAGQISHERGGVLAELESQEAVIDKQKTEKIINFIDQGLSQTENKSKIVIIFEPGSVVTNNEFVNDETISLISDELARRIENRGTFQ